MYKALIISAKKGDASAFEELYKKLYTPLYRYVLSKCHDTSLVDDVCQQTFLRFYQALEQYEPEKTPLAYLFTIAKRLLINHKEKKTFTPSDESFFENYKDDSVDIVGDVNIHHLASSINEYVLQLSEDEQDVIRLYFYAECTYKEISETLDKEEAYIRKIKERALKKLRILTKHLHEA